MSIFVKILLNPSETLVMALCQPPVSFGSVFVLDSPHGQFQAVFLLLTLRNDTSNFHISEFSG